LYTTVYYTEHVVVMSCVNNFGIIETLKICIILYSSLLHILMVVLLSENLIVTFSYCVLTALICEKITFCKCNYRYRDILDNQGNFVVNIEIFLNALSHTSSFNQCINECQFIALKGLSTTLKALSFSKCFFKCHCVHLCQIYSLIIDKYLYSS